MKILPPIPGGDRPRSRIHFAESGSRGPICGAQDPICVGASRRDEVNCEACAKALLSRADEPEAPGDAASPDQLSPIRALSERFEESAHLKAEDGDYHACRHRGRKVVHHKNRTVHCRECGALIDPFDALAEMTHFAHRQWHELRQLWSQIADAEGQLEDVKRRLGNEKAKLRRAVANRIQEERV